MTSSRRIHDSKPPVLLRIRASEWYIGITVFFAAFNVSSTFTASYALAQVADTAPADSTRRLPQFGQNES